MTFALLGAPGLGERRGPPVEELVGRARSPSSPGVIELTVRNDGPDAVAVAQVIVNDALRARSRATYEPIGRLAADTLEIDYPWIEGEAYEIALLTSTGGTIAAEIPVAVETPGGRRELLRADGAARHLRRRHPGALGMLWLPLAAPLHAGRDPRADGASRSGCWSSSSSTRCSRARRSPARARRPSADRCSCYLGAIVGYLHADRRRRLHALASRGGRGQAASGAATSRCSSPSASACTTSARGSRSAPPTRPARSRSARCS